MSYTLVSDLRVAMCPCHGALPNPRSADFRSVRAFQFVISAGFSEAAGSRRKLRAAQVTAVQATHSVLCQHR